MDSLSITSAVAGLTTICVETARLLSDLKDGHHNANLILSAIYTKATAISASLSRIQTFTIISPQEVADRLTACPKLGAIVDQTLTGCLFVFDVLQAEIQKVAGRDGGTDFMNLDVKMKPQSFWNDSTMQQISAHLTAVQDVLPLLSKLLEASPKQIVEHNAAVLSQIVQSIIPLHSVRSSHAPKSIFDMSFTTQSFRGDSRSSFVSSAFFSFDDEIVGSRLYRRVLARASSQSKDDTEEVDRSSNWQTISAQSAVSKDIQISRSPALDHTHLTQSAYASLSNFTQNDDLIPPSDAITTKNSLSGPVLTATPKDPVFATSSQEDARHDEWILFYKLKLADIQHVPVKEIERQEIIHQLIHSEAAYLNSLRVLRYFYKYRLYLDPSISTKYFHKEHFPGCEDIYHANEFLLYDQMILRQNAKGPWIPALWDIFQNWLVQSRLFYVAYAANLPYTGYSLRKEQRKNSKFARFIKQAKDIPQVPELSLHAHIRAPIARIQRYGSMLETILKLTDGSDPAQQRVKLEQLIEDMRQFIRDCNDAFDAASEEIELYSLFSRVVKGGDRQTELSAPPTGSKIQFNGSMLIEEGTFRECHEAQIVVIERPRSAVHVVREPSDLRMTFVFREACNPSIKTGLGELFLIAAFDGKPIIQCDFDNSNEDPDRKCRIELKSSLYAKDVTSVVLYTTTKEEVGALVTAITGTNAQRE